MAELVLIREITANRIDTGQQLLFAPMVTATNAIHLASLLVRLQQCAV